MYQDFFGLSAPPFLLTYESKYLYLSKAHSRAINIMEQIIDSRDGFAVITGEIGSGKTSLISKLLTALDENIIIVIARIYDTNVDSIEFFHSLLYEFGVQKHGDNKVALLGQINTFLQNTLAENKKVTLIVDDAQNLSEEILEEIRLFADLEANNEKLMNLILIGQSEFNKILEKPKFEQLAQRIRFRCHIGALDENEMDEYIRHRLSISGLEKEVFTKPAMQELYKYTGGIPRLINALCNESLICASAEGSPKVTNKIVQIAANELELTAFDINNNGHDHETIKQKLARNINDKHLECVEHKINHYIHTQDKRAEEIKNLLLNMDMKIKAFEDKLSSMSMGIKTIKK